MHTFLEILKFVPAGLLALLAAGFLLGSTGGDSTSDSWGARILAIPGVVLVVLAVIAGLLGYIF